MDGAELKNARLFHKVNLINQMIEHKSKMNQNAMTSLSRGQGRVLAILQTREGLATKDLAMLLDVSISSMNSLLSKLENNGYIIKVPSREDKRTLLINLTEKGRNCELNPSVTYDIFNCFEDDEKDQLDSYLNSIITEIRKEIIKVNPEKYDDLYERRNELIKELLASTEEGMYWLHLVYGDSD